MSLVNISKRELATILHALRFYQDEGVVGQEEADGCLHFQQETPLTDAEIDQLCERLNTEDQQPPRTEPGPLPFFKFHELYVMRAERPDKNVLLVFRESRARAEETQHAFSAATPAGIKVTFSILGPFPAATMSERMHAMTQFGPLIPASDKDPFMFAVARTGAS